MLLQRWFFIFLGCTLFSITHAAKPNNTFAQKVCCTLFGNEDAPAEVQNIFKEALAAFNVGNADQIPIKKIRSDRKWLNNFSSFTWFGIWVNEKACNGCPQCLEWTAYHEAAHYAKLHPHLQIILGSILLGGPLALHGTLLFKGARLKSHALAILPDLLCSAALVNLPKTLELQADKLAAQKLCQLGRVEIVEHVIEELKKHAEESSLSSTNIWFPANHKTIAALEKTLDDWNKKNQTAIALTEQ